MAMLSLMPLTGLPLPFISHGGSALMVLLASLGLLFNMSRYTTR
jgi:cell division protein FtsW